jgi:hypothetical protein
MGKSPGEARHGCVARVMRAAAAALLVAALAGCAAPQPWVKPYEREHFADPIMAANRDPVSAVYLDHVFESREGARGATGSVGGGCGCN